MKKNILAVATLLSAISFGVSAQSAVDAYSMTPTELRGTARFVSMGGAFTSLGGDLSTMTQNPAGIGVYRRSEVGLTFDISIRKFSTQTSPSRLGDGSSFSGKIDKSKTRADFDNFGYVGTVNLNGARRNFNWGVSYNRLNSFYSEHTGYNASTSTSLSNYIAGYTNGVSSTDLGFSNNYNPYANSSEDWLSILAYTSYMINNPGSNNKEYQGLFQNGTVGDAAYTVREHGYVDEYNIDFGGNVSDIVYWGIGVGIQDMSYRRDVLYSESMADAAVFSSVQNRLVTGDAGFDMNNTKLLTGTGANLKLGVIIRPTDMFRVGLAVHTPTWYHMRSQGDAYVDYSYFDPSVPEQSSDNRQNPLSGSEETDIFDYNWRLNSPWRFMAGASLVIGSNAIVSLDYERVAYGDMKVKYQLFDDFYGGDYVSDEDVNNDIKTYYQAANIVRLGLEYRVTPRFSVRAGYNYQTSSAKSAAENGDLQVFTSGTDPSFSFNKDSYNVSFGLGYRYKAWYIDLAYQYNHRESTFKAYTNFDGMISPSAKFSDNRHNIVLSTGFKF